MSHDFGPDEARIFRYEVRGRSLYADPSLAWKRLNAHFEGSDEGDTLGVLLRELAQASDEDGNPVLPVPPIVYEAESRLAAATAAAFRLPAFDEATGSGLTEAELLDVAYAFLAWGDGLKKGTGSPPSSSPSTDGPPEGSPGSTPPTPSAATA